MKLKTAFLCHALAATLSTGCAAMSDDKPNPAIDGTSWVLASMPGKTLANGSPATLQLQDGRTSGSDGCNRFTGTYQINGSSITFPAPAGTMMACPPGCSSRRSGS
jgi:heat shock protein HslJ